jgi:hypothetical protein
MPVAALGWRAGKSVRARSGAGGALRGRTDRKSVRENLRSEACVVTVPNLTQEDEASSLRRSREPYVKELGKLTP